MLSLNRSSYYYRRCKAVADTAETKVLELAQKYKRYGYRKLYQVDEFNSKAIAMYVDWRINSRKVIEVLDGLKLSGKLPAKIKSDNGRKLARQADAKWFLRTI